MVRFFVHKPIAVIMVYIALVLVAIQAVKRVPVSSLPDIDIPEITVHVNKENTTAKELESAVIRNLRNQLMQVPNLADIHSETRNDYSILKLRFDYDTDINYAFIEVNEKIDLAMNAFPRDMQRPRVIKASASDIPVFYLNLSLKEAGNSAKFISLSNFASQVVRRRLEQLPEIAFADITGVSYPEISITPNLAAMAAINLGPEDFRHIIESNNLLSGNLSATDGILQYYIRFVSSEAISAEDLRNISFRYHDRIFKLSDVATVKLNEQDSKGTFIANNRQAINLAIIKQSESRMEDLRTSVTKVINTMKKDYPEINFEQIRDETELLEFTIDNLKQDLYLGSGLAFILMFFFLRNLRAPLLIGVTIPVCLVITILLFNLFHLTINIISLSGLVLGVGLMIDNSIIVIDNITQHRERGLVLPKACSKGASEVFRPMIASGMTTCSVFLPLIFLSGISGALFYDQAMAITIGLVVSLLVSITLLPVLYNLFHQGEVSTVESDFFKRFGITFFEKMYESGFDWVFRNKLAACMIVLCLIISNIFVFAKLKKEKLPALEQTELVADIDWNQNITIGENKLRVNSLIQHVNKEIIQSSAMIGEQQYFLSKDKAISSNECRVYFKTKNSKTNRALMQSIQRYMQGQFRNAALVLGPPKNIFEKLFGDNEPDLEVRVSQSGDEKLPERSLITAMAYKITAKFPGAIVASVPSQRTITLQADENKLLLYDVSMDAIYDRLRSTLNVNQVSTLYNGQQQIPVVLTEKKKYLDDALRNITVMNRKGVAIPVSSFLKISSETAYKTIEGGQNGEYISLFIQTTSPEKIADYIEKNVKNKSNLDISLTGSFFSNKALIKEMTLVLLVAVFLLYFILAAQFESLIQPLIVLFELPISMSGALIMLYVFNSSINLVSLIGLIVICGIVINDSILKIDVINELRRNQNYSLIDAIHTGGIRRLKSIIMTSLTTVLSVVPFLFGNDMGSMLQRPLSLALIGGMLIGTPVSLYFIPLVYWFYYRKDSNQN